MAWSTLEQLKALRVKTEKQKEALRREDYALCEKYPGQHVAFTDDWNGDELVRTVLVTAVDYAAFYEQVDRLPAEVRSRLQHMQAPTPGVVDVPSVWLE